MLYLNNLVVFSTFFNFCLNLSIRSSWSEPQSAPSLGFADYIELLHFACKEYDQSDSGIGHLGTSMCRVFTWRLLLEDLLLEEGVCYDQCVLLAKLYWPLPCFIQYSKAKFACYSRCFLTSYFCIPVHYNEKDIFWGVSSKRSCRSS